MSVVIFVLAALFLWMVSLSHAQVEAPVARRCDWIYEKAEATALSADKAYGMMSLSHMDALHFYSEMSRTWSALYIACRHGEVK